MMTEEPHTVGGYPPSGAVPVRLPESVQLHFRPGSMFFPFLAHDAPEPLSLVFLLTFAEALYCIDVQR